MAVKDVIMDIIRHRYLLSGCSPRRRDIFLDSERLNDYVLMGGVLLGCLAVCLLLTIDVAYFNSISILKG